MNYNLECNEFSDEPETIGWNKVDYDGDGNGWIFEGFDFISTSYDNSGIAIHPDDWLISPAIHIPNNTCALTWYADADFDEEFLGILAEHYTVLVSTTGTELTDFTEVLFDTTIHYNTCGNNWHNQVIRLDNYSNQDIHIAFRHHDAQNVECRGDLLIDDICIYSNIDNGNENISVVKNSGVTVFPNPASDLVKVTSNETIQSISVFTLTGTEVFSSMPQSNEYEIETSSMTSGTYFIRITTLSGTTNQRLVVR